MDNALIIVVLIALAVVVFWVVGAAGRKTEGTVQRRSGRSIRATFRGGKIMSMHGVAPAEADACELAISKDKFSEFGTDSEGRHILHIQTPSQDYVAIVAIQSSPPFGEALIIAATYATTRDEARDLAEQLMAF